MKHTPGPWTVHEDDSRGYQLEVRGPEEKGSFYPKTIVGACIYGPEDLANYHLIAAAPKMLAALEKAAEFIRDEYECLDPLTGTYVADTAGPIWAVLSKAIAEARAGESDVP